MIKYKLTNQDMTTHNGFQWVVGVPVETDGSGNLCGPGWLHYYHDPMLALLLNPIHADIVDPRLWEVEAEGAHLDDHGLKGGCTRMTLLRELPLPEVATTQRVAFGVLCAYEVYADPAWRAWADAWLSGDDRSARAAEAAEAAAWASSPPRAAWAAAEAAEAAAWAAARAAWAAARAAEVAAEVAAAEAAWAAVKRIDLIAIARRAMEY